MKWTEFTFHLLTAILTNWRILVKYFERIKNEKESKVKAEGFLKLLKDVNKLKTLCFITDLGYIYSRFQKQIQFDDILIFDITEKRDALVKIIESLRQSPVVGGWESTLLEQIESTPQNNFTKYKLKGIELFDKTDSSNKRSKIHHLYISTHRSYSAVRNDTIEHILNYLQDRLDPAEWNLLKPLERISGTVTDDELKQCHNIVCPDFELIDFVTSYREASGVSQIAEKKINVELLQGLLKNEMWKPLSMAVVCKFINQIMN